VKLNCEAQFRLNLGCEQKGSNEAQEAQVRLNLLGSTEAQLRLTISALFQLHFSFTSASLQLHSSPASQPATPLANTAHTPAALPRSSISLHRNARARCAQRTEGAHLGFLFS